MKSFSQALLYTLLGLWFCGCKASKKDLEDCHCNGIPVGSYWDCPQDSGAVKIPLDTLLRMISAESWSFVVKAELLQSKSFRYLYNHPDLYKADILNYIQDDSIALSFKSWALDSQTACDDQYFKLFTICGHYCSLQTVNKRTGVQTQNKLV